MICHTGPEGGGRPHRVGPPLPPLWGPAGKGEEGGRKGGEDKMSSTIKDSNIKRKRKREKSAQNKFRLVTYHGFAFAPTNQNDPKGDTHIFV